MMRLADFLLLWNGDPTYGDYWECNLWNGILAQQHPDTRTIAYFLPLHAGAQKTWGSATEDFWCCHGSLVQAHAIYANHIWYQSKKALTLSQYIPNEANWELEGETIHLRLEQDHQLESHHRPENLAYELKIGSDQPRGFSLRLRLPWWVSGKPEFKLNGDPLAIEKDSTGYRNP